MKRDRVDFVIGKNDQFPGFRSFRVNDQNVSDRYVVRKNLERLDQNRFRVFLVADNRVGDFQDSAVGRADEEYVVSSAVDAFDVGVDRNDGQTFPESGLDENRSVVRTRD